MKSFGRRCAGVAALATVTAMGVTGCGGSGSTNTAKSVLPAVTSSTSAITTPSNSTSTPTSPASTSHTSAQATSQTTPVARPADKQSATAANTPTSAIPHTTATLPKVTHTKRSITTHPAAALPPGTVCYATKDPNTGHPAWTATAGKNVSQVFCANVARAAIAGSNAGGTFNVKALGSSGQEITMSCQTFDTGMTCTGGTDAEVDLGLNTGF